MVKFLNWLDRLSFFHLLLLSVACTVVLSLPLTLILVRSQQQSETERLSSKFVTPTFLSTPDTISPGPVPDVPPKIGRVFPWVGKAGDVVWIQGEHFGDNPIEKHLTIGTVSLSDDRIISWRDTQIQTFIPEGVSNGTTVVVSVGQHPPSESLPMVLYDQFTTAKVSKRDDVLFLSTQETVSRVRYWTGDERIPTRMKEEPVFFDGNQMRLFDLSGQPLLSFLLFSPDGTLVPYYVDPIEFGF